MLIRIMSWHIRLQLRDIVLRKIRYKNTASQMALIIKDKLRIIRTKHLLIIWVINQKEYIGD